MWPGDARLSDFWVMVRWAQGRLPIIVGLALVGGAIAWMGWAYRLPPGERGDALVLPGFVLGLVGVLVGVVPLLARLGGRPAARPVDVLAAGLALAVDREWRTAANERQLLPDPIPVRWSLSDLTGTGSVTAAVGTADQPPAFPPLPGQSRTTEAQLRAGGGRIELHAGYAGLASGRIIVAGAPGAGKSGAAILLLLDALTHRDTLDKTQRARVPVPVLLTSHGWNPHTTPVQDWLADRLAATYPMFGHRRGRVEAAELVAARDRIALILDGLDEMDAGLRPAALQALSDAPFRVIVLTRSRELIDAASQAWLFGAVAVRLHDVTTYAAAAYLKRARPGPPPSGWTELLTYLRAHPDGVLARGLSTPLTLTLLRDTYQPGDDVRELLDPTRYPTPDAIEQHLIARVLPAAYTPRPGRPAPRYTEAQARQALTLIASKMGPNRDLAWWNIPHWAPTTPRVLATALAVGLVLGLAGGLVLGLAGGLVFGLAGGRVFDLAVRRVFGLAAGRVFELVTGLVFGRAVGKPQQVKIVNWRAGISRRNLGRGLVVGLTFGLLVGFIVGLAIGLMVMLMIMIEHALIKGSTGGGNPLGPREIWCNDRVAGLVFGLVAGLVLGLTGGLVVGLVGGLASGLVHPETWPTTLAWFQLWRSGQAPAVRLMPFLEDAREREVLRTVGGVYQFRHATLQDQLASQATSTTQVSSAAPNASQNF